MPLTAHFVSFSGSQLIAVEISLLKQRDEQKTRVSVDSCPGEECLSAEIGNPRHSHICFFF
jgi:hypothetical protein